MKRQSENKIILVVRKTRLDDLITRFNTQDQARFYVEHLGADFNDYQHEDRVYKQAIAAAQAILATLGRVQVVDRIFMPNFIFGERDMVVAIGQDGLVANTLKYLDQQVLLGVNPDPERWEGVLLPFQVTDLATIVPDVFAERRPIRKVSMAQAKMNDGQTLFAVNDLFIGPRNHSSARYHIQHEDRSENHSSSGVIVSTGLGSTGWLRSILKGASGITSALTGTTLDCDLNQGFSWDADHLFFSVREPWPSTTSNAELTFGKITRSDLLTLVSQMPDGGVIFSDGIQTDFLQFNSGARATIGLAEKTGHLVV